MNRWFWYGTLLASLFVSAAPLLAQNASLVGTVRDPQQAAVPEVSVTLTNIDTGATLSTRTDSEGNYEFPILRPGAYSVKTEHAGFRTSVRDNIRLAVTERGRVDVALALGETSAVVTVEAAPSGVQTESSSLGDVVTREKIVEIPLNGRFFLDLALLTAGTVVPSTNNRTFLASPSGIGASGINAAGTREDSTNYLVDGINLSDMVQNQITFQPNIEMVQEFKVQTNAFSAQYGRNAGIIINAISRSGGNDFHGSLFEFVRNEKFDAKNFFDPPGKIAPFKRNIFGYSVGGPILRNRTFFFTSYEGRRGREVATLNTVVPTAAQRAGVTHPVVTRLLELVPAANDPTGARYVETTPRKRTLNQYSGRIDHHLTSQDQVFGSFIINRDSRTEPTLQNNNLPGFGDFRPAKRLLISLGHTRVFSPTIVNEVRIGLNRVRIDFLQDFQGDPATYGISSPSKVFPVINVTQIMSFGGINGFPQGRGDTLHQYSDTLSIVRGRHSLKFGGELRRFRNNNLAGGTGGVITFPTMAAFLAGTPSTATQTPLTATPALRVTALAGFAQDDFKINSRLTLNLGLRWEYNGVPNEKYDRQSIYLFDQNRLVRAGEGVDRPYEPNSNYGPRFGFAYDPTGKGKTAIRGGVGLYYDQPVTNIVTGLTSNPPFISAVNITSNVNLAAPFNAPAGSGTAINAVDPDFENGRVLSYNLNVQQELFGTVFQATYVGSQGRHLRINGDYNHGINGARPISGFSSINLQQSVSNSNYNGLWLTADRRLSKGLHFSAAYTFHKSIDNNSVGSSNAQAQDYRNLAAERALADFDARHRFVFSGVYQLPFATGSVLVRRLSEGWSVSPIVNLQSGNPFSPIVPLTATLAPGAIPNPNVIYNSGSLLAFDRPDYLAGQSLLVDDPDPFQWVNRAAFVRRNLGFGNAGRNILRSPGFQDVDFSVAKLTQIKEGISLQFRVEFFNLFNHPNLGQPVNSVLAANFGQILATRTARGDLGSSRQVQFGLKLLF
jgi:hypothetical protein